MSRIQVVETNLEFGYLTERAETSMIVIHHIGEIDRNVHAEEVHEWHKNNGWAGCGYHFLVLKDGTVERGRPEKMIGAHAQGFNARSIGINIVGDFEQGEPTAEQIESAAQLIADLSDKYGISITADNVVGHRDLMPTDCPGRNLYSIMDILRGKAVFYQNQGKEV